MFKKLIYFLNKQEVINNLGNYLVNDPSTPDLVEFASPPSMGLLRYNVRNFNSSPKTKAEQQALNCYITVGNCINLVQKNSKLPIKNWSSTSVLEVSPQAGQDLNAYYDRVSLKFFYYKVKNKLMFTADSSDVVAHETGHAILDAMRPDFWSVQSLEIWSFHEAFSDIMALVSIMQYESVLKKALLETKNDISLSNSISKLAEEFGILVYKLVGKKTGSLSDCLRNPAIEKFKYVDPSTLPSEGQNNELCAECHSFGRVFSAVWYNIFVEIYKKELSKTNDPLKSIKISRDKCFLMLLQAIPNSPLVSNYFSAVAKSMLAVCKSKYPEDYSIVEKCFVDWNIIKPMKIMSNTNWQEVVKKLKRDDKVVKNKDFTAVTITNNKLIKLNNISALSGNLSCLNNVELEVPADEYYEFDSSGNLIYEIKEDNSNNFYSCLVHVEKSLNKMWSIKEGKLVRNYIV